MELEELIDTFRRYLKEADGYEKELEHAIEHGNREFGYSGADYDKRKIYKELETELNAYIDQRVGLILNKVIAHVKDHYGIEG